MSKLDAKFMKYTVKELSQHAGVSVKALHYYHEIGLLFPMEMTDAGYRIYGDEQVNQLQQILFFKEMGFALAEIQRILKQSPMEIRESLVLQLARLEDEKSRMELLIENLRKTIEGEDQMNQEKFEGFKKALLDENEQKYGAEIREKYGEEVIEKANQRWMNQSPKEYEVMEILGAKIRESSEQAVLEQKNPLGDEGQAIAKLHKEWLLYSWPSYSMEAHQGLAQMYVEDSRFTAYYDKKVHGCAEFLRDAIWGMKE